MQILYFDALSNETIIYFQTMQALEEEGVVLLRGIKLDKLKFESLTKLFCKYFFRVTSREKFLQVEGDGFSTLTPPESFVLLGHVEVDYVPCIKTPDIGFLFCLVSPYVAGGETFLIEGASMFNSIPKEIQDRFKNENITYEFLWEPQRWKAQYSVQTEKELHDIFESIQNIQYSLTDGWLHMFYTTSAIVQMKDGSTAFSNAILPHLPHIDHPLYSDKVIYTKKTNQVYWEGGEPFSTETINQLIDAHDKNKYLHRWEDNDLLIFDNIRYLHGREETVKTSKRVLLSRFGYLKNK
ncbi:TauD/TfdA family dioxygenase [Sulfurovum riftiae]|uniref:TauD/TfdA-like domain-containing protein n=1 Tax=Sulfurovum riftiae TaxID=1630136 RepID=A0A151CHM0_9BACT|nr:TauD/TfdA family dioxygenase [Sulfurovum riftiae]KYJ87042.1 hypothetical protein AS592_02330 [Sulfurovum riftiae]